MSSEKYAASLSDTAVGSEPSSPIQAIRRSSTNGSYHKLASFMGTWSDVAIFRRFGALNAQNLLYLQAEITHLERELELVRKKEESTEKGLLAQRSWFELSQDSDDGRPCRQWLVIQDIREKLAEYNAFLLQYQRICALHGPSKHDLKVLREWLVRKDCGDNFLQGVERDILHAHDEEDMDEERASEMVTLSRESVEKDAFSRWLSDVLIGKIHRLFWHRFKSPVDEESGIYHYRKSNVRAVSHLAGVLLAATIPAASIFTLYYVRDMADRLGVLLAYSALFSICLGIFTTARRVEIFGATAAFASVQVVFVGTTGTGVI